MTIEKNRLLDLKIIKSRLKTLKDGYASCAIENLLITQNDKKFMENMVNKGLNPDDMIKKIKQRLDV